MSKCMNVTETAEIFGINKSTVFELFRTKGSPAFKIGKGKTSSWRCFEDDFRNWLQKVSEKEKG